MKQTLETLKGKIAENTLKSGDIFAFTDKLKESMRKGTPIVRNVSPANIDLLKVYAFALRKMEMTEEDQASELRAGDWRDSIDDFSQLKYFIDEMQESELVKNVAWNVHANVIYDIPNPDAYKRYVYWKIKSVLDNMELCELV
ncbi:hypothetical protein MSSAC_0656 [Methanosarcina siciliae C2J]|uniref:Uncharacterized protein n=3 Tax=Methanosarcina siciliae TaxID=38027 RepID=A0A0E3PAS1_9EURY|nr:hypothetical protein [Methanosarcina siciliae]AKB27349.1 hypothetical protein MSSIT_0630 [Methanosarcina siciliae T4/M]AKB31289.1 hypothetical protein MSSIH_0599 [Methanosarcina siciliae HI350]AKB35246.1 hypothetical protein MSSAC_0656 [Methanosarcina siciliae C2J]